LQVHHKDGDHFNNELENLQLICPNCHSQTNSYAGKKNLKGVCTLKYERSRKYKCTNCEKPLHRQTKTGLCIDCYKNQQKK
jgi:Zn finger protein HypA/HybF involved in hydrogenase expression